MASCLQNLFFFTFKLEGGGGAAARHLPFWCSSDVDIVPYNTGLLTGINNVHNKL